MTARFRSWSALMLTAVMAVGVLGCQMPARQIATAESGSIRAPQGTISVYQLAGLLRLRVDHSSSSLATLSNDRNRVRIFSGPVGRIYVNGRPVDSAQPVVPVGGMLFVAREMAGGIGLSLSRGPAPRARAVVRRRLPRQGARVVIDPGHGGKDTGAVGVNGALEKDVNLVIAGEMAAMLTARGMDVRMSRTTDTFVELNDRAQFSNDAGPGLFVSIHANSVAGSRAAHGFEVYVARSASAESLSAAYAIAQRLAEAGVPEHGAQPRRANFRVLVRTTCPAVLVETGYLSNSHEAAQLVTATYQRKLAAAIANGVADFLGQ